MRRPRTAKRFCLQIRAAREAEAAAAQALSPQLAALEAQWEVLHAVSGAADVEELLAMWQGALRCPDTCKSTQHSESKDVWVSKKNNISTAS